MTINDDGTILLRITLGHAGDNSLQLRFPPEYESEILPLLDANDIDHNTGLEFSAGVTEWIEVLLVLGPALGVGLPGLAKVIHAIGHRNDGKKVELEVNGEKKAFEGYSVNEVQQLLDPLPSQQAELDRKTKELLDPPKKHDQDLDEDSASTEG